MSLTPKSSRPNSAVERSEAQATNPISYPINPKKLVKARRQARILALQALYEIDCSGHPIEMVLEQRLAEVPLPVESVAFVRQLIAGVMQHKAELDKMIQRYAPEWPVDQMAVVDRNVLRIALFEFTIGNITPTKVAINEAVELAKLFGSDSAPRFVNGVLGTIAAPASA